MALSAKRRAFIEQYLRDFNGTQAAIRAGYSERSARVSACKILARPEVQAEIQRRLAELKMGTDEVLLRLTEQARAEYAGYLNDDGTVDLQRMLDDGKAHLVRGTKWDRQGNLVVEFYDAQAALVQIGRAHGMFIDKTALTDPSGENPYVGLSDDELIAAIAAEYARLHQNSEAADGGPVSLDAEGAGESAGASG